MISIDLQAEFQQRLSVGAIPVIISHPDAVKPHRREKLLALLGSNGGGSKVNKRSKRPPQTGWQWRT